MFSYFKFIISSLFLLFIYWVVVYFSSGYNLTDNTAHLDISSMISNLNNTFINLKSIDFTNITTFFDDIFNSLNTKIDTTIPNVPNVIAVVLTGVKYLTRSINYITSSFRFLAIFLNAVNSALSVMINFAIGMIKFIFQPVFI